MSEFPAILEKTERVNGFECDFNGFWKPAAIFQHLTETASEHAEKLGYGFDAMLARDLYWVHSRMKIKFFDFPRLGEPVILRTWPKAIHQKLFFIRDFEVLHEDGRLLAGATSAWLVINASTRRMVPAQALNFDLPSSPNRSALDESLEKLGLNQKGVEKLRQTASYATVDMQGHVNNSRYVEWVTDCFDFDFYRHRQLDWMQINYDHEIRPGETISLLANQAEDDPDLWMVEGLNLTRQTRSFESALHWRNRANEIPMAKE